MKSKYKILIVHGASMTFFIYTISFSIMGIFGMYYAVRCDLLFSPVTLLSLALIFNQVLLKTVNHLFQKFRLSNIVFFKKLQVVTDRIISGSTGPWKDYKTMTIMASMILGRFLLLALRYHWAAYVFDLEVSYWTIVTLTIAVEFSNITFKVLPGNIGLSEIITGSVFGLLGQGTQEGLLIALFIRFTTLLLTFTIGTFAVRANLKYFNVSSIQSLWKKVKTV